ncbi:hypothetical protein [Candidatus Albibeggiatoa sp. nov. BB20]|uniref:hypothetical protein n=1 Tax=Candidatus Albibeggiatoa sp. nov. BB20 TaxID=3162723 RepID=UPI0033655048
MKSLYNLYLSRVIFELQALIADYKQEQPNCELLEEIDYLAAQFEVEAIGELLKAYLKLSPH